MKRCGKCGRKIDGPCPQCEARDIEMSRSRRKGGRVAQGGDDRSNVVSSWSLGHGKACVECRIISMPGPKFVGDKYATQWLLIKDDMVVEIDPIQVLALRMMEEATW